MLYLKCSHLKVLINTKVWVNFCFDGRPEAGLSPANLSSLDNVDFFLQTTNSSYLENVTQHTHVRSKYKRFPHQFLSVFFSIKKKTLIFQCL